MLTHRIIFFDLETGGLSPSIHPIIQIAAVRVNPAFTRWTKFERKLKFDVNRCDPGALSINSYDADLWAKEAVEPREAAEDFAKFLKDGADITKTSKHGKTYKVAQLAAHNAPFDHSFLFPWYKELGIFLPANWHVIDTIQLALTVNAVRGHSTTSLKLSDLTAFYEIPLENAHDAMGDVQATAMLGKRLLQELGGGK